ncbi:hypothetical protein EsH8_III_001138 [Colletotrichum jinshuiense]
MISRTTARHLLRELSSHHRAPRPSSAIRPFTSTPSSRLQAQRPPTIPIPPASPLQSHQQQQAAANAALQNLSHLTPAQITALLSTSPPPPLGPPGALPHHHPAGANPQQPRSRRSVLVRRALWALAFFALGYKLTADQISTLRFTTPFLHGPVEINDPQEVPLYRAQATFQAIDDYPMLQSMLPAVNSAGTAPLPSDWENWEPYEDFSASRRGGHLCAGALNSPNGLGLVHIVFRHRYTGELVLAVMFGQGTSGWPSVVHGGMLSTVMDEAMGRLAALSFPANTAVTAKLAVDFKVPVTPGMLYVVRVHKALPEFQRQSPGEEDKTDRKMWVVGRMEDVEGATVCEAKGLFVVPKGIDVQPLGKRF